jgi:AraC-like DNA-binding protein
VSPDTLSDVLRVVRLSGAVFFDNEFSAPWVAETPPARDVAPYVLPGAEHVVEYHLLVAGRAYAGIAGETPIPIGAGDLIMFPQGDSHVLSSAPGMRAQPDIGFHQRPPGTRLPIAIQAGGGGERAALICGFIGCDRGPYNPLLATLPRVLVIRHEQLAQRPVAPLIAVAVAESKARRSGGECVLSRLSELLFVEAVRLYVEGLSSDASGWLAGLRDPQIGQALAVLHGAPDRALSLDDLAREVGMSRSLLAERFVHFVGVPPMQYLAQWRMQLAAERLHSSTDTLATIAERVGYGSESAFSRAFKRLVGVAPASFRQGIFSTSGGGDSRSARKSPMFAANVSSQTTSPARVTSKMRL